MEAGDEKWRWLSSARGANFSLQRRHSCRRAGCLAQRHAAAGMPPSQAKARSTGWGRIGWGGVVLAVCAGVALAHPLDGYKRTGIRRLLGYRLAVEGKVAGVRRIPPGGQWGEERIKLRLLGRRGLDVAPATPKDAALQAGLEKILGGKSESYGIALGMIETRSFPAVVEAADAALERLAPDGLLVATK